MPSVMPLVETATGRPPPDPPPPPPASGRTPALDGEGRGVGNASVAMLTEQTGWTSIRSGSQDREVGRGFERRGQDARTGRAGGDAARCRQASQRRSCDGAGRASRGGVLGPGGGGGRTDGKRPGTIRGRYDRGTNLDDDRRRRGGAAAGRADARWRAGDARVAREWNSDGWMRSQVRRWITKATAIVEGGLAQAGAAHCWSKSVGRGCCCSDCLGLRREICTGLYRSWIVVVRDQSGSAPG